MNVLYNKKKEGEITFFNIKYWQIKCLFYFPLLIIAFSFPVAKGPPFPYKDKFLNMTFACKRKKNKLLSKKM